MKLEVFDGANPQFWNNTVNQSINGTLSHTWEWLKIVEKHSNYKLIPLVFFDADDDKPFGAIPLFLMRKMGLKMLFSPPPGSSINLGPVLVDKGYKQHKFELAYLDFQHSLDSYIQKLGVNYINVITSPALLDMRPFSWNGYRVTPSYTYRVDLSQGEKALWSNLSASLRHEINQTRSKGVQVVKDISNPNPVIDYVYEELEDCYDRQHLKLPLKKAYLQEIVQQFSKSNIKICLAQYEGKIIGAQISTIYKDRINGWVGAVRSESNDLQVNGLMLWDSITGGIADGYRWLENMGANTPHLCSYKAKFCPSVEIYFDIKKTDLLGSLAEKVYFLRRGSSTKERK